MGIRKINKKKFTEQEHKLLAKWAIACAERVLPYFEKVCPKDDRPKKAIEAGKAWVRGEITVGEARKAAIAAHAAARDVAKNVSACAAARAAGQAVSTVHMAGHAVHAANYAVKAVGASNAAKELEWRTLVKKIIRDSDRFFMNNLNI